MKKDHVIAMLEDMQGKFNLILETMIPDIQAIKMRLDGIEEITADMQTDLQFHRAWLRDHEIRLTTLEGPG